MAIHNLSWHLTPFIGHDDEIAALTNLLEDPTIRLLTLVGPGGIGKSRLAIEVAKHLNFADGVYFVPLQSLHADDNLFSALANALLLRLNDGDDPHRLYQYLHDKSLLFILDNFEHLLDAADAVTGILNMTPQIKFIVTSRARLNLRVEQIWPVDGLDAPEDADHSPDRYSAVQLFVECAKRSDPHFSLNDQRASVMRICWIVNGSPLAIELAASWVSTLQCDAIAEEIQTSIDFLATNQHDVPDRHRSIRAVFDHSWQLLTEEEQNAFRKLPIFRGGFTAEAASEIAGVSLTTLSGLIHKSLLQLDANGRYNMHELLRQYAEERLDEVPQEGDKTRTRHADYFTDLFYQAQERFLQDLDQQALDSIHLDIANLESGVRWRLQRNLIGDVNKYTVIAAYLYQVRGIIRHGERTFRLWINLVRNYPASVERDQALGCILAHLGWILQLQGRNQEAVPLLDESLTLLDHPDSKRDFAQALAFSGRIYRTLGQFQQSIDVLQQALSIFRVLDLSLGKWMSLGFLSETAIDMGEFEIAQRYLEKGLEAHHAPRMFSRRYNLSLLGLIHVIRGEIEQARAYLLDSIHANRVKPDVMPCFYMLSGIALYLEAHGQHEAATEVLTIIANHPMGDAETQSKTSPQLAKLRSHFSPEILDEIEARAQSAITEAQRSGAGVILAPAYFDRLENWIKLSSTRTSPDTNPLLYDPLSHRELEVLDLVAQGFTNQEIADSLYIGVSTVKKHINHIFSKLHVSHRAQAVALARKLKILP